MPYITQQDRDRLREVTDQFSPVKFAKLDITPGDLNYIITKLLVAYWGMENKYQRLNDIFGVLACVSHEFYRRVAERYENIKIHINGDVF